MAAPKEINPIDLLSESDREFYNSLRSSKAKDGFLKQRVGEGVSKLRTAQALGEPLPSVGTLQFGEEKVKPFSSPVQTSFTEEEAAAAPEDISFGEGAYETESERLKREAEQIKKDIAAGKLEQPSEETGLPPVEAGAFDTAGELEKQKRFTPITAERAKAGEKVSVPSGGELKQASPAREYAAKLSEDEVAAWTNFKDELLSQGASLDEAEAQASQLVAAIVQAPREIGSYSETVSGPAAIDKEAYAKGEAGFAEAMGRQPLESTSAFKFRQSREDRGAAARKIIEDQVTSDLIKWQDSKLPDTKESFWVSMKDPVAGGIDPEKVAKWKEDRFRKRVYDQEANIVTKTMTLLINGERAKGAEVAEGSPEYKRLKDYATQIGELWLEEAAPEIYKERTSPRTLTTGAKELLEEATKTKSEEGQLYETKTGAALRDVGGLIRFLTDPVIAAATYDVNPDGTPVDPTDWNYKLHNLYSSEVEGITKLTGKSDAGIAAAQFLGTIGTLGTGPLATSARQVGSGVTGKDELTSGNYLSDVAYAMAVGRSVGDDFSDLPATKYFYENVVPESMGGGKGSLWPFMFGLGVEVALPVLPTTAVGGALKGTSAFGKTWGLAPTLARLGNAETAAYVAIAGDIIENPFTKTAGPLARRSIEISKARDIAKAFGAEPMSYSKIFSTEPVTELAARTIAPAVADAVRSGGKLPEAFASIVKEVEVADKTIDEVASSLDQILQNSEKISASPYANYISRVVANSSVKIIDDAIKTAEKSGSTALELEPYYDALRQAKSISKLSTYGTVGSSDLANFLGDLRGLAEWTVDAENSIISKIKSGVGDLIVSDRIAAELAKSNYNDWLFVTPTMIVKNSAWEKSGKEVDDLVKSIIFGTSKDSDIQKIAAEMIDGETVIIKEEQIDPIIERLSKELGPKVSSQKYWSDIATKISSGEKITVEEFNAVNDVIRSSIVREVLKGSDVLNPRATSKLTEKAAVPVVRRLEGVRAVEDVTRATGMALRQLPKFEGVMKGVASTTIGKAIYKYTSKVAGLIPSKAITTEGISLPIYNALQKVGAQVNNLPAELIAEFRLQLANTGANASDVFTDMVDKYVTAKIPVSETGLVRADAVADMYWDMTRRFFSLPDLSNFKLGETFLSKDGPIYKILERRLGGIDENGFLGEAIGGVQGGRSQVVDIFEEIISEVRSTNPFLQTKGARTITADAIADIFIGKMLDAKKDIIIEGFAAEVLMKHPELVYTYEPAKAAIIAKDAAGITSEIAGNASRNYDMITKTIKPGEKWGAPIGLKTVEVVDEEADVVDVVEVVTRDTKGLGDYDRLIHPLVMQAVSEVIGKTFTGKAWDKVAEEVYFKVTNTIISKGLVNSEQIAEELQKYYDGVFKIDGTVSSVQRILAQNYPAIDFGEWMGKAVQEAPKRLGREEYKKIADAIIADPAKFTDDGRVIEAIKRTTSDIGELDKGLRERIMADPAGYMGDDLLKEFDEYSLLIQNLKEGKGLRGAGLPQLIIEGRIKAPTEEISELVRRRVGTAIDPEGSLAYDEALLGKINDWISGAGTDGVKIFTSDILKEATGNRKALVDLVVEDTLSTSRSAVLERRGLIAQIIDKGQVDKTTTGFRFKRSAYTPRIIENASTLFRQGMIENALQLSVNDVTAKMIGLGFDFKSSAGGFEAINVAIDNLNGMRLFLDPDSYKFLNQVTMNNRFVAAGLEDLTKANKDAADFWKSRIGWMAGTIRRNTIGGMLGGIWSMNTRFLGVNNFTAPIIASVTNPTYVMTVALNIPKATVKPILEASKEVPLVGRALAGASTGATTGAVVGGIPGALAGAGIGAATTIALPYAGKLSDWFKGTSLGRKAIDKVPDFIKPADYVVSANGKIFTNGEISRIFRTNVYKMSQYDFDFGTALLQDVKRAAEVNEAGYSANFLEQVRRGYGPFTRNSSFWNIVGSQADYVFREAVFKEALIRGTTEAEAATLAKNTLLDYSQISEWERKLISSWVLFYSFMRQSTWEAVLALGRPQSAATMTKMAIVQKGIEDQYLKRHDAYTAKYGGTRLWAWTDDVTYDGYKVGYYGPSNPMFEAYSRLGGGIYTVIDAGIKGRLFATGVSAVYEMTTKQPHIEYAKQIAELVSPYSGAPNGYFPSAMIVTATETGLFDYMKNKYDLRPVKDKNGNAVIVKKGEPTYGGYQWTFGSTDGKIAFLTDSFLLTSFGAERTLKDWAAATAIANGKDPKNAELKKNKEGRWVLYLAGLETPMSSPEWVTAQEELAKQLSRELQAAKAGKSPTPIERYKMSEE